MASKRLKKQLYHYTAVFEEDTEVGGYTVTIPSLPGCISEGDTFEEAAENIQEAAELYLAVMSKQNANLFLTKEARTVIAPVAVAV